MSTIHLVSKQWVTATDYDDALTGCGQMVDRSKMTDTIGQHNHPDMCQTCVKEHDPAVHIGAAYVA